MIDPTIDDYLKGKIYKLVSEQTEKIYIGSTIYKLPRRLSHHLSGYKHDHNYTTAFEILQYDDVRIELLETYPSTDRCMLEAREGEWIEKLNCVNQMVPGRNPDPDKYQRGKIYKLISSKTDDIYIGSTIQPLPQRLSQHKTDTKNNCHITSVIISQYEDVEIVLLETYPTTSAYFLYMRERYWIESLKCVNKVIPCRTPHEYYIANIEKIKEYKKQYNKDNKEKISEQHHQYYIDHIEKIKEYKKQYNKDNKEKISERHHQYYIDNIETIKEYDKQYYKDNIEKISNRKHEYYIDNKEKISVQHQQYYIDNKEKISEQHQQYYIDNTEKISERQQQYYINNSEIIKEYGKKYYKENKEKISQRDHEYYNNNKEKIKQRQKVNHQIQVQCDICQKSMCKPSLKRHKKGVHNIIF